jgi:hypothetical protein
MADIAQVVANYDALVGVALGAGLTYGFGALNRRHQEAREDKTRWYNARHEAYVELYHVAYDAAINVFGKRPSVEARYRFGQKLTNAAGKVALVGSPEVVKAALRVLKQANEELAKDEPLQGDFLVELHLFLGMARRDLGHP